ncbi:hypothetical protein PsorP6_017500 [Peronosclerospora sorghi]|uniref:Uncharacterized protein n=1 Tax=Peronosclerospora sorghi TaxID=230839 RepID=A0ACC0WKP0_9STRA|nr:hypothetical protein PsorP6_017500 [Peronosclerospora sorghi]
MGNQERGAVAIVQLIEEALVSENKLVSKWKSEGKTVIEVLEEAQGGGHLLETLNGPNMNALVQFFENSPDEKALIELLLEKYDVHVIAEALDRASRWCNANTNAEKLMDLLLDRNNDPGVRGDPGVGVDCTWRKNLVEIIRLGTKKNDGFPKLEAKVVESQLFEYWSLREDKQPAKRLEMEQYPPAGSSAWLAEVLNYFEYSSLHHPTEKVYFTKWINERNGKRASSEMRRAAKEANDLDLYKALIEDNENYLLGKAKRSYVAFEEAYRKGILPSEFQAHYAEADIQTSLYKYYYEAKEKERQQVG